MKRFLYIITMIYYAFAWMGIFFDVLPFEANICAGVVGLLAIGESPENVELSNLIHTIGWSVYFLMLIIFTTLSNFWKKDFKCIPVAILSISLFFNMFLLIHGMFIPILINIVLIAITVYIGKTEKTPEQIKQKEMYEKYLHEFITEDLSKEA
ncbi:MAG: hypothetical protein IJA43_07675 [Clostridia bacterium]|nr:hypothetical protein [Clostridia bacterium]